MPEKIDRGLEEGWVDLDRPQPKPNQDKRRKQQAHVTNLGKAPEGQRKIYDAAKTQMSAEKEKLQKASNALALKISSAFVLVENKKTHHAGIVGAIRFGDAKLFPEVNHFGETKIFGFAIRSGMGRHVCIRDMETENGIVLQPGYGEFVNIAVYREIEGKVKMENFYLHVFAKLEEAIHEAEMRGHHNIRSTLS